MRRKRMMLGCWFVTATSSLTTSGCFVTRSSCCCSTRRCNNNRRSSSFSRGFTTLQPTKNHNNNHFTAEATTTPTPATTTTNTIFSPEARTRRRIASSYYYPLYSTIASLKSLSSHRSVVSLSSSNNNIYNSNNNVDIDPNQGRRKTKGYDDVDDRFICQVKEMIQRVIEDVESRTSSSINDNDTITSLKLGSNNNNNNNSKEDLSIPILDLSVEDRESYSIAQHLQRRITAAERNNDCPRCWMQRYHCICSIMKPIPLISKNNYDDGNNNKLTGVLPNIRRIFVLMNHKEIYLAVDTAKVILGAFPDQVRLVIGGIPEQYQPSMIELKDALTSDNKPNHCTFILYPSPGARTYQEIINQYKEPFERATNEAMSSYTNRTIDIIVIDGTWSQARKLYNRYIAIHDEDGHDNIWHVQLSDESLQSLVSSGNDVSNDVLLKDVTVEGSMAPLQQRESGKQLRHHPEPIREIATVHALQLLLQDMIISPTNIEQDEDQQTDINNIPATLSYYQHIARTATMAQLGPVRLSPKKIVDKAIVS